MLGPQSDTTQIHPGTHQWSWKKDVYMEGNTLHFVYGDKTYPFWFSSVCTTVASLDFCKRFCRHLLCFKNAIFFLSFRSKKSQLSALFLWKLSLETCIISRQIYLLNLSKASGKGTNNMSSCEYSCKGIPSSRWWVWPWGWELSTEGFPYRAVVTWHRNAQGYLPHQLLCCSTSVLNPPLWTVQINK